MPKLLISAFYSVLQMRSSMESSENEQLKVLMAGFRGQNLDESDFANANVRMRLVTDLQDQGLSEALPLAYDPEAINRYAMD
jgi:aarF domain-containing kinase